MSLSASSHVGQLLSWVVRAWQQTGSASLAGMVIEGIVFLVLMEAARDAEQDLTAIIGQVKAINNAKTWLRDIEVQP
jgi:hypothetical protein